MKKAQILIRLEESLLILIETKSRELQISKQQWIQDLVYRELASEIEVETDNDITDIKDINSNDIPSDIDILKNDIAQIMEQIHQLGENINRLDESDKTIKTELEKLDRRLYGIKEFIIEQDERVCDEIDSTRDAIEVNKDAIESLRKTVYAVNESNTIEDSVDSKQEYLEAMDKIPISTVAETELGKKTLAPMIAKYFNDLKKGHKQKLTAKNRKLEDLEAMGYIPQYKLDVKTKECKITHFTFKRPK